ncbi:hypothetical protein [Shewanella surugensis]|uniref:Uncharacterized protein n=1 Tax=Shewanella surugensis TaxID=212020 RepID=A0ABT0LBT3_9GAMM|nr:hypothetical protein [Shewanella surugensis]MCL1125034.1 hypothetical protein [Shewanella surugensis]
MKKLKQQFLEVSDVLVFGNPAIIEKGYWVVALLVELERRIQLASATLAYAA